MTIDFSLLGTSKKVQARRYEVLSLMVKAFTPTEIQSTLQISFKTIENDISYIRSHPLHLLSTKIAKDLNNSAYELKIRELELVANQLEHARELEHDSTSIGSVSREWLILQDLIRKTRVDSLKLQGLMNEKIEHEFKNPIQISWPKKPQER